MRLLLALVTQSDPTITQAPDGWTMLEDADPQEFVLDDDSDYDVHSYQGDSQQDWHQADSQ